MPTHHLTPFQAAFNRQRFLQAGSTMALLALPMMVWSVFPPTVWPVMLALSVGQGVGTLSFLLFLVAVARDLNVKRKLAKTGTAAE